MVTYGRRGQYETDDTMHKKYVRGKDEPYQTTPENSIDALRPAGFFREKEFQEEQKAKEIQIRSRAMLPRLEEDQPIESLQRVSPEIIGSLFDRIKFLEERITELQNAMRIREQLNQQMIDEIDKDIEEKNAMIRSISDMDEQRNLKLDISVLRREKRREYVQFWRDVLELRTELRELMEEYQIESKIGDLFKKLSPADAKDFIPKD